MRERPVGDAGHADELELARSGYRAIAGVDEAGRGAWAGPLVAAAVVLPDPIEAAALELVGLRDSKQLTARQREEMSERIRILARGVGVGIVAAARVDEVGLTAAGREAMTASVGNLGVPPDYLLIDAFRIPALELPQRPIIFGDCLSISIAAASVIAKVTRDRLLDELGGGFPAYGFPRHKGYGTREHRAAICRHGPCLEHRFSYAPIRRCSPRVPDPRRALGEAGEHHAVAHLQRLGYAILGRNVRTRWGELDIVALEGAELVFVEVKARAGGPDAFPEEAVTAAKAGRLVRLAEAYIAERGGEEPPWRIDVVAVLLGRDGSLRGLRHTRSAMDAE